MITLNVQEFYQQLLVNKPLVAIDYGKKKIGIAISDHNLLMAMPYEIIVSFSPTQQIIEIMKIIKHINPCGIIMGLPLSMDNTENSQTFNVYQIAIRINFISHLPIFMQDERLSTRAAHSLLKSHGLNRKDRSKIDDALSASLILQTILDSISRIKVKN